MSYYSGGSIGDEWDDVETMTPEEEKAYRSGTNTGEGSGADWEKKIAEAFEYGSKAVDIGTKVYAASQGPAAPPPGYQPPAAAPAWSQPAAPKAPAKKPTLRLTPAQRRAIATAVTKKPMSTGAKVAAGGAAAALLYFLFV